MAFISTSKHLSSLSGTDKSYLWKSKGMSEESITNTSTWDNNFAPNMIIVNLLSKIKFNENSFKQDSL